ncbi:MAG: LytR/AlgR family response regulator transcription factor [Culicoidibacterales bacterium]
MLTLALCDDQIEILEYLERKIRIILGTETVQIFRFTSGEQLLAFFEQRQVTFDAVFLDIGLTKMTGIETAMVIRQVDQRLPLVFLTSSKAHAIQSYRVHALDYLLKPLTTAELVGVLQKIKQHQVENRQSQLIVKSKQDLYAINLKEVMYFESSLRTITAYFHQQPPITFYKKLNDLETEILQPTFLRIHRSYLVNLLYVKNIVETDVVVQNQRLPLSKTYAQHARRAFMDYIQSQL